MASSKYLLLLLVMLLLRLISNQENYPWIGTDKKNLFVLKSLVPTLSSQDKEKFTCQFQSTANFPGWKLAFGVYPHRAGLKNMPGHGGNRTYDLWNTSPMLCQLGDVIFRNCV